MGEHSLEPGGLCTVGPAEREWRGAGEGQGLSPQPHIPPQQHTSTRPGLAVYPDTRSSWPSLGGLQASACHTHTTRGNGIMTPILQMSKLRHRDVLQLVQGHTAGQG